MARRAVLGRSTVVLLADSTLVLVGKNYEAYVALLLGTLRTECLDVSLRYGKHLGALFTLNHGFIVNWFLIEFYVLPIHGGVYRQDTGLDTAILAYPYTMSIPLLIHSISTVYD